MCVHMHKHTLLQTNLSGYKAFSLICQAFCGKVANLNVSHAQSLCITHIKKKKINICSYIVKQRIAQLSIKRAIKNKVELIFFIIQTAHWTSISSLRLIYASCFNHNLSWAHTALWLLDLDYTQHTSQYSYFIILIVHSFGFLNIINSPLYNYSWAGNMLSGRQHWNEESLFSDPSGNQMGCYQRIRLSSRWTLLEASKWAEGDLGSEWNNVWFHLHWKKTTTSGW